MALGDIRREDVLGAVALLDDPVEGQRLLDELRFKEAKDYRLVYKGRFYPSKAVVGIAHGIPAGREYLTPGTPGYTGGLQSVVPVLEGLGFYVDDGLLHSIKQLRVDQTHGRPAAYQYVVLLWAIARARSGLPRMIPFNDVRAELAQILAPFAVAQTAPDPVMPWIALAGPWLWELDKPSGATSVSESDVKSLNLAAGLSELMYNRIRRDDALYEGGSKGFVGVAVDVIAVLVTSEPGFLPLRKQLGLADLGSIAGAGEAAEVSAVAVDQVPLAAMNIERTEVERSVSTAVTQNEAQLTRRFQMYLEKHHRKVKRYRIIQAGGATLYSDLADVTENVLYEAKGSADRMSVRLALGQVLDYGRFVPGFRLAVLLPEEPPDDLVELLETHDVGCVVETTQNEFFDMTTHNRCP